MTFRILRDSFLRQKRRKAVILAAVSLGTAAAASLGNIALDVGDKMNLELKGFGANLTLVPRAGGAPVVVGGEDVSALRVEAALSGADVLKAKDNFWKNNILALAPILEVPVRVAGRPAIARGAWFERAVRIDSEPGGAPFVTGLRALNPYWRLDGHWPDEPSAPGEAAARDDTTRAGAADEGAATGGAARGAGSGSTPDGAPGISAVHGDRASRDIAAEIVLGRALAEAIGARPGASVTIEGSAASLSATVAGVLTTGGDEESVVLVPIELAGRLSGLEGRVSRIELSALTTPESAVYERLGKNPRDLSPAEFEKWTCTPFVSSIAYELERVIPDAEARIVRRVADSEGRILRRTSALMLLIASMAGLGAALTVTSALTTSVLERRGEIGLLKAMGAGNARVVGLFLAEATGLGTIGGLVGAGLGALMARWISVSVFGSPVSVRPLSVPLAIAAALAITSLGCILPVRRILRFRPFEVLRGL